MANIPYLLDPKYEDNPDQKKVIEIDEGFNLVLAPPGCGKTDLLAERVIRANCLGVNYKDMLCLTFTNRASRGMMSRIKERAKDDNEISNLFIGNIHRYCSSFLFDNHIIPSQTTIIDEFDMEDIILSFSTFIPSGVWPKDYKKKELVDKINKLEHYISQKRLMHKEDVFLYKIPQIENVDFSVIKIIEENIDRIILALNEIKDNFYLRRKIYYSHNEIEDIINETEDIIKKYNLLEIFNKLSITINKRKKDVIYDIIYIPRNIIELLLASKYYTYKREYNLIDFDDLLIYSYNELLKEKTKIKKYSWIQVDEVQDLNPLQLEIIDQLIDQSKKFVVLYLGDEQQAIYSFLGAKLSTLYSLKEKCNNKINRLYKNYRSPEYLLDIFNEYATKQLHIDKNLLPDTNNFTPPDKDGLLIYRCKNEWDQYPIIENICKKYSCRNERVAILVNSNKSADCVSKFLKDSKINHFKISGKDIFSEDSIKTILSHFNIINCENNKIAWSRIFRQLKIFTYSEARRFVKKLEEAMIYPSDFINYNNSSYTQEFLKIYKTEFIVFDTETTGLDIYNDDIVQIAANKYRNGEKVDSFNIFLETEKDIPTFLGEIQNPLCDIYKKEKKTQRQEGLLSFVEFVGKTPIIAHNAKYDYNILKYNLHRECNIDIEEAIPLCFDSLKLARIVIPNLKIYKLKYLLEELHLNGENSHLADEDIIATYEVIKYCINRVQEKIEIQNAIFKNHHNDIHDFKERYSPIYKHTTKNLHERIYNSDTSAFIHEFIYTYEYLLKNKFIGNNDKIINITSFLNENVINREIYPSLYEQISRYINDMTTFKEADLCDSESMKEKIFISTIHKAKGLEFENVIVINAIDGIYPYYMSETYEERSEDARKFYVAISRAKKRLNIMYYTEYISESMNTFFRYPSPFLDSIKHFFVFI